MVGNGSLGEPRHDRSDGCNASANHGSMEGSERLCKKYRSEVYYIHTIQKRCQKNEYPETYER